MALNPFVEFARDPVAALAWLGYALLLAGIVLAAVPWAIRQGVTLVVRYRSNRTSDAWWSFGASRAGYIPPLSWLSRAFGVLFVLAIASWATSALFWLVGGV
jgi:hypothetical protein